MRMLAKRIIPCLDVADGRVKKGVHFVNLKDVGDPVAIAAAYEKQGADISSLIYKKYGVDSLLLAQNISYYAAQPEKCRQILSHVETRLKQEDSLSKKQQTPILPPEGMQPLDSL